MTTSFKADVVSLFSRPQIQCMSSQGVYLDDYAYMANGDADGAFQDHANARHVYSRLEGTEGRRMPPNGPYWTQDMLDIYQKWMSEGFQP